jgi:hypothetical protein
VAVVPHFRSVIVLLFHRVEKKKRDPDSIQSQKDESSKKKSKPPSLSAGPKLDVVKYVICLQKGKYEDYTIFFASSFECKLHL